ncbi:zinc ribbon domain-containing protein [Clostridioides sp. ES-S-0077-01]|uniref:zinc ribbon domain-containing protein n=1 Tax=Clostridioides sp. ES-S-0077-01 TaxID=2770782 RepID=UPI001D126C16|nr:zinc ribbon domain-containing protein [Clostridioides sp. ES-S-0077-01]
MNDTVEYIFCSECGARCLKGSKFCNECGTKIDDAKMQKESITKDKEYDLKGVDLQHIMQETSFIKASSIRRLKELTGIDLEDCRKILEEPYRKYCNENADMLEEKRKKEDDISKIRRAKEEKVEKEKVACCPKCGSTSLSANKKGFGIGKAVVGASLAGGIGLVAGNIGAKKVRVTCLNCGKQFWAGKK